MISQHILHNTSLPTSPSDCDVNITFCSVSNVYHHLTSIILLTSITLHLTSHTLTTYYLDSEWWNKNTSTPTTNYWLQNEWSSSSSSSLRTREGENDRETLIEIEMNSETHPTHRYIERHSLRLRWRRRLVWAVHSLPPPPSLSLSLSCTTARESEREREMRRLIEILTKKRLRRQTLRTRLDI